MSSIGTGYDLSASTFSPDGRVFQVEYAIKAVENSSTAIGIRCKDGVVFGVEKLVLSKLYEEGSNKRIFNIDRHVGMVHTQMQGRRRPPGGCSLASRGGPRRSIQLPFQLRPRHPSQAPVGARGHVRARLHALQRRAALRLQLHPGVSRQRRRAAALHGGPLGRLLRRAETCRHCRGGDCGQFPSAVARGCDDAEKVSLNELMSRDVITFSWLSDHTRAEIGAPSPRPAPPPLTKCAFQGYWGCAIGKAKQAAKTEIEKLQMKDMTCKELVKEVAKIIYIVHDEVKDKAFELELSWVGEITNGRHVLVPKDVREEAEKYAKDSLEEEDDSDEDNM